MSDNTRYTFSEELSEKLRGIKKYLLPVTAAVTAGIFTVFAAAPMADTAPEAVYEECAETDVISDVQPLIAAAVPSAESKVTKETAAAKEKEPEIGSITVTVEADGESCEITAEEGSTAADILAKAEIELGEDDIVSPEPDEQIADGDTVTVTRVEYIRKTHVRSLKYSTEYREDDTIPEGESEIIVEGAEGEIVVESLAKVVNGELENVEILKKEITKPAVNRVVLKGALKADAADDEDTYEAEMTEESDPEPESETENEPESSEEESGDLGEIFADEGDTAPERSFVTVIEPPMHFEDDDNTDNADKPEDIYLDTIDPESVDRISMLEIPDWLTLDENGIPVGYTAVHTGRSCAYTASPDALMSTGKAVFQGYVAVDPTLIPYGSELYIIADDGSVYGYAIAADTGYSVRAGKIVVDLFMNEYDDCIQWGNRSVTVYVLS